MATVKRFEDLEIWIEARRLSIEIINISKNSELKTDFRLRDQVKSAAGSVMDNIAEGFERNGNREFIQFLSIAKASAGETRSQIYRIYDNSYIEVQKMQELVTEYEKLSIKIHNFINYLNKNEFRGTKFMNK